MDQVEAKKRERFLSLSMPCRPCRSNPTKTTNRPSRYRTFCQRLTCLYARPTLVIFIILCILIPSQIARLHHLGTFFGFVVNGYTRIVPDMNHCVRKTTKDDWNQLPVYSDDPSKSTIPSILSEFSLAQFKWMKN